MNIFLSSWTTSLGVPKPTPPAISRPRLWQKSCTTTSFYVLGFQPRYTTTRGESSRTTCSRGSNSCVGLPIREQHHITSKAMDEWNVLTAHSCPCSALSLKRRNPTGRITSTRLSTPTTAREMKPQATLRSFFSLDATPDSQLTSSLTLHNPKAGTATRSTWRRGRLLWPRRMNKLIRKLTSVRLKPNDTMNVEYVAQCYSPATEF